MNAFKTIKDPKLEIRKDGWGYYTLNKGYYGIRYEPEEFNSWVFERIDQYDPEPVGFYDQFNLINVETKRENGKPYYRKIYKDSKTQKRGRTGWIYGKHGGTSEDIDWENRKRCIRLGKFIKQYGIKKLEQRIKDNMNKTYRGFKGKKYFATRLLAIEHEKYWEIQDYDWKRYKFRVMKK